MIENAEEHFRYCIYCKADCHEEEPEHAEDCPSVTRVFPVTEKNFPHGVRCVDCNECFEWGEHHTLRKLDSDVYEVICLGCAALDPEIETV